MFSGSVISCTSISSSLISIQIFARPHSITVIHVYGSTSDHNDEEVKQFYKQLYNIIANISKKNKVVV